MDNVIAAFNAPPTAKALKFEADMGASVSVIAGSWQGHSIVADSFGNLDSQPCNATVDQSVTRNPVGRFTGLFEGHGGVCITAALGDGCLLSRRIEQGRRVRIAHGLSKIREVRTHDGRLLFGPA